MATEFLRDQLPVLEPIARRCHKPTQKPETFKKPSCANYWRSKSHTYGKMCEDMYENIYDKYMTNR